MTGELIERYGGRLAGSAACDQTAQDLCARFVAAGAPARLEEFQAHPGAFNGFYRIDVTLYCLGLALLWLDRPLPAALLLLFMVTAAGLEFGYYLEFYDRFYPLETCRNVIASLEPRREAKQVFILSAHHDSARELRFLKRSQKLYALKIIVPDAFRMTSTVFSVYWCLQRALLGTDPAAALPVKVFLTLGLYFVFTKFFLFSKAATPGAGDNLIASAMLLELARRFADPDRPGSSILDDTRLVFASFDAEEAGLRGSRAYAKAHRAEFSALPTLALNIDSIYKLAELKFLVTDLNDHVKLDQALVTDCLEIASGAGYVARTQRMRFGGGATDAAELALAGARATTMIAMPSSLVRDGMVYHTMRDTVDAIEPQAVEACLEVAFRLVMKKDGRGEEG